MVNHPPLVWRNQGQREAKDMAREYRGFLRRRSMSLVVDAHLHFWNLRTVPPVFFGMVKRFGSLRLCGRPGNRETIQVPQNPTA
jgi:hypothetical protein